MLRIENIKVFEELNKEDLLKKCLSKAKVDQKDVTSFRIARKSIDARKKEEIFYNYSIDIEVKDENKYKFLKKISDDVLELNNNVKRNSSLRPVVIGSGPAGLFCAKYLAENGAKPILIEQGKKVEDRIKDVELFRTKGILNTKSNVQFGEGGAGTFSDGKLTSGINSPLCRKVLRDFVTFGGPEEIEYVNKPHIGTDKLVEIVKNIREYIIDKGGDVFFEEKFIDFEEENGKIISCITDKRKIETDCIVLAVGHSARDTFEMLYNKNIKMEKKNFSVGVRIEHKQQLINEAQYGNFTKLKLPPAEYKMAYHNDKTGRSCYTFCMCPGGEVIASSSEEGTIVTNGMSKFARDKENANSALLVNVTPDDFKGDSPLEGMYFQKEIEQKAFKIGGENYNAPCQRLGDFLNIQGESKEVIPSYVPGVKYTSISEIFPKYVVDTLKEGIIYFDKRIKGFASPGAIITAPETRSSSPVKVLRNEKYESVSVEGLFPCGEGPGHAGGIMSAAVDGINVAIKILEA